MAVLCHSTLVIHHQMFCTGKCLYYTSENIIYTTAINCDVKLARCFLRFNLLQHNYFSPKNKKTNSLHKHISLSYGKNYSLLGMLKVMGIK